MDQKPTPTPSQKPAAETPAAGSALDSLWITLSLIVLVGAMAAFYYYEGEFATPLRVLGLLGGLAMAIGIHYMSAAGKAMWAYVLGSRIELRKVVWPTRAESVQTTLMIAVVVLIMSLMLWGLDSALLWGVKTLTGRG